MKRKKKQISVTTDFCAGGREGTKNTPQKLGCKTVEQPESKSEVGHDRHHIHSRGRGWNSGGCMRLGTEGGRPELIEREGQGKTWTRGRTRPDRTLKRDKPPRPCSPQRLLRSRSSLPRDRLLLRFGDPRLFPLPLPLRGSPDNSATHLTFSRRSGLPRPKSHKWPATV